MGRRRYGAMSCPGACRTFGPTYDEHKVYVGNLLARFSCHLCREAKLRKVPWSMENPRSSRLWILPPVLALERMKGVRVAVTDFCMWSGPYRKSTSFMYWKVDLSGIEQWRCLGAKRGVCARSGKAHVQLRGQNSEGGFWTKINEPYPPALCRFMASRFDNVRANEIATGLDLLLRTFYKEFGKVWPECLRRTWRFWTLSSCSYFRLTGRRARSCGPRPRREWTRSHWPPNAKRDWPELGEFSDACS